MPDPSAINPINPDYLTPDDQARFLQSDEQRNSPEEGEQTELEPLGELRKRVSKELISFSLLPADYPTQIDEFRFKPLTPQHLVKLISDHKILDAFKQYFEKHPSYYSSDHLHTLAGQSLGKETFSEQWNLLSNYDKLIVCMMATLDKDGQIEHILNAYTSKVYDLSSLESSGTHSEAYQDKDLAEQMLQNYANLISGLQESGIFRGKSILEIGGYGLHTLFNKYYEDNTPLDGADYDYVTSGVNEGREGTFDPNSRVTSQNYQERFRDDQFDITITRCVFEPGSGVGMGHRSDQEGESDLLKVLSKITKKGGFSIHEGVGTDFDDQTLDSLGFERILTIELGSIGDLKKGFGPETLKKIIDQSGQIPTELQGHLSQTKEDKIHLYSNNDNNGGRICILRKIV